MSDETIKRKYIKSLIEDAGLATAINNFQNILDVIRNNVFNAPKFDRYSKLRIMTCPGIISSIDTLRGINELCEIKDFPDVYLLIRKLRDNLFLDLFLFEVQKSFERIPNHSFKHVDLNNIDEVMKSLDEFYSLCVRVETSKDELNAINKWKENELLMMGNSVDGKEYFYYNKYILYLRCNNEYFNDCYDSFLKELLSNVGLKLNDYAHSNSESMLVNRQKSFVVLKDIKETLINIEHLFLITLFFVDSTLFSSDDYLDYIECNLVPPEGSQYWINGYILEALIDIKLNNKELFQFMIDHNKYSMNINGNK